MTCDFQIKTYLLPFELELREGIVVVSVLKIQKGSATLTDSPHGRATSI